MAIGGRIFELDSTEEGVTPYLKLNLLIGSPDPENNSKCPVEAIIDTGSDFTLINNSVIEVLGLSWINTKEIEDFYGKTHKIKFYSAKVILQDVLDQIIEIGGIDTEPLIGRDIFTTLHMLINYPRGVFELANSNSYIHPTS